MTKQAALLPTLKLSFAGGDGLNEDRAVRARREDMRLLAVFDGCGGMGGRRYPHHANQTGAYIASGLYAGCLQDWFASHTPGTPPDMAAEALNALFAKAAQDYHREHLHHAPSAVTGSMVKTLPSTAAIALVRGTEAVLFWAGNSRIYLLTESGLRQLTQDDLLSPCDAFDSLYRDAPIANYLCADQPFALHTKIEALPDKGILLLATDGAYQAQPSPMHFEALLLDTLANTTGKKQWKKHLMEALGSCAADDVTLLLQPFGFADYAQLPAYYNKRYRHVQQAYILPADQAAADSRLALRSLWEMYQKEA